MKVYQRRVTNLISRVKVSGVWLNADALYETLCEVKDSRVVVYKTMADPLIAAGILEHAGNMKWETGASGTKKMDAFLDELYDAIYEGGAILVTAKEFKRITSE